MIACYFKTSGIVAVTLHYGLSVRSLPNREGCQCSPALTRISGIMFVQILSIGCIRAHLASCSLLG